MKIFILSEDMSGNGPLWMNIFWPHYTAYSDCIPTVLMNTPYRGPATGRFGFRLQSWQDKRQHRDRLCDQFRAERSADGPNVLLVWALNIRDIERARLLEPVWDEFDTKILWILDTVDPHHADPDLVRSFDAVACICGDIAADFEKTLGTPTIFMPPHTDVLRNGTTSDYRPFDLLVVGRRLPEIYDPIHLHFNAPGSERTSVDLVTRTGNFSASVEEESQLLMSAYARAKLAFCFEPSQSHPRFRGFSPMTERWPHAWASGCSVIGTKPWGRGAAEQMDWGEASIDLPATQDDAIELVESLLADTKGLARRRAQNVAEAAKQHDSRRRLHTLFVELDLPLPEALTEQLTRLDSLSEDLLQNAA